MHGVLRALLFASVIAFGAAASASARVQTIDEARCGGDNDPICRTRTVETCTRWYLCGAFKWCCADYSRSTVHDYFRSGSWSDGDPAEPVEEEVTN